MLVIVNVAVLDAVAVADGGGVRVGVKVGVGGSVRVNVRVGPDVNATVWVGVRVALRVGVCVEADDVGSGVWVRLGETVAVGVAVIIGVGESVLVSVGELISAVTLGVSEGAVGEMVGVDSLDVCVGLGVAPTEPRTSTTAARSAAESSASSLTSLCKQSLPSNKATLTAATSIASTEPSQLASPAICCGRAGCAHPRLPTRRKTPKSTTFELAPQPIAPPFVIADPNTRPSLLSCLAVLRFATAQFD